MQLSWTLGVLGLCCLMKMVHEGEEGHEGEVHGDEEGHEGEEVHEDEEVHEGEVHEGDYQIQMVLQGVHVRLVFLFLI